MRVAVPSAAAAVAAVAAFGVLASGVQAAEAAGTYPPSPPPTTLTPTPTGPPVSCNARVLPSASSIVVAISPVDPQGSKFQLEKLVNGSWVAQDPVYVIMPPDTNKTVKVSAGDYRVKCFGGTDTTSSDSEMKSVKKQPSSKVDTDKTTTGNTYVPGQYSTLVKGIIIPPADRAKYMKPTYRVLCRPLRASAAGQTAYCRYRVTNGGALQVKVMGTVPVRVRTIIVVRPKPAYRKDYAPIIKRKSFVMRPTSSSARKVKLIVNGTGKQNRVFKSGTTQTLVRSAQITSKYRNRYLTPRYRVKCQPIQPSQGQFVSCRYNVTSKNGLQVTVRGSSPVAVDAFIASRPKKGSVDQFLPVSKTRSWTLRPKGTPPPAPTKKKPSIIVSERRKKGDAFVSGEYKNFIYASRLPKKYRDYYHQLRFRVLCKPASAGGSVTYCKYIRRPDGGMALKIVGKSKVRVSVIITANPRAEFASQFVPTRTTSTWTLRPKPKKR